MAWYKSTDYVVITMAVGSGLTGAGAVAKDSVFTMKIESELREAFMAEAEAVHRPASQIVREFMRDFVRRRRDEREHDAWFRGQIEAALDDSRASVPHEDVARESRDLIERIASGKGSV